MVAKTDQKARCFDLVATVMALVRDGKRDAGEVAETLQVIKDEANFAKRFFPEPIQTLAQSVIDCDADPFVPSCFKLVSHTKGGQFVFDPAKVKLHLSRNQQGGKVIVGHKLRKELANEPALNANVLDYLLKNPHLIPEEWKQDICGNTRYIFFWGTIYRDLNGYLYVRYLYFNDGRWYWKPHWLGEVWFGDFPAALRAS